MKQFAELVTTLGASTKTNEKLDALSNYFSTANDKDKVWVIAIFSGRRPRRAVNSTQLWTWCNELAGLPFWLFEECYHAVGDLAETIALLLPESTSRNASHPLHHYLETLIRIEKEDENIRKGFIVRSWESMTQPERFVFNKLITGNFRIGVSQQTMVNALAKTVKLESSVIAHRISGNWDPLTTNFSDLLSEQTVSIDHSKPYPFYLAYAVEDDVAGLGEPREWQAEWKWDGIRGQIIKRKDELFVWSRGEELMTEKFPEFHSLRNILPNGIVLDGEIMAYRKTDNTELAVDLKGLPLPFAFLQTRIGRKNISKKNLLEAPVGFFAYDLLEYEGTDFRESLLVERRRLLEKIIQQANYSSLLLSPVVNFSSWEELANLRMQSRNMGSEGIMLKRKDSIYQVGRKRGDWWKWKIDPLVIDAVMIYAQKGHGRRSSLYTDYTFAVRDGEKLVGFTKAYSGLTDKEFSEVDSFVRKNSLEKFGPVRTVKPELVFEIAFEGIAASNRHKSGVALRFPRISRWRKDKKVDEINTLEDLKKMLQLYGK
jgi:DNA ligase-1